MLSIRIGNRQVSGWSESNGNISSNIPLRHSVGDLSLPRVDFHLRGYRKRPWKEGNHQGTRSTNKRFSFPLWSLCLCGSRFFPFATPSFARLEWEDIRRQAIFALCPFNFVWVVKSSTRMWVRLPARCQLAWLSGWERTSDDLFAPLLPVMLITAKGKALCMCWVQRHHPYRWSRPRSR